MVNHLVFKTNYGRLLGPYETATTANLIQPFTKFNMPYGMVALAGNCGSLIDGLKFYFYNY